MTANGLNFEGGNNIRAVGTNLGMLSLGATNYSEGDHFRADGGNIVAVAAGAQNGPSQVNTAMTWYARTTTAARATGGGIAVIAGANKAPTPATLAFGLAQLTAAQKLAPGVYPNGTSTYGATVVPSAKGVVKFDIKNNSGQMNLDNGTPSNPSVIDTSLGGTVLFGKYGAGFVPLQFSGTTFQADVVKPTGAAEVGGDGAAEFIVDTDADDADDAAVAQQAMR
jgi:hypothetical protein